MDEIEEHEVVPYELAIKAGIVKTLREFRRRYQGFFNGPEHMLTVIRNEELEPSVTNEEVFEYVETEYVSLNDRGMIHLFSPQDEPIVGPAEREIMEEEVRYIW